jgi:hypothetical protein
VTIRGWKEVIAEMERISGVERSRFTLWRYAQRRIDPLPIVQVSKAKGRVRAEREELQEWWQRHRFTY